MAQVGARATTGPTAPQPKGPIMTGLPASLSIALWLVGSLWLLALLAYVFGAPQEIVYAALALGLIAGAFEWLLIRGNNR
jgi:hypothetical protein